MILQATCVVKDMFTCSDRRIRGHTCSLPSSLRASFTLPILPAPMVLPRIHLPDWVGMTLRLLDCFEEECAWSGTGWEAGPLWEAVAAGDISDLRYAGVCWEEL